MSDLGSLDLKATFNISSLVEPQKQVPVPEQAGQDHRNMPQMSLSDDAVNRVFDSPALLEHAAKGNESRKTTAESRLEKDRVGELRRQTTEPEEDELLAEDPEALKGTIVDLYA